VTAAWDWITESVFHWDLAFCLILLEPKRANLISRPNLESPTYLEHIGQRNEKSGSQPLRNLEINCYKYELMLELGTSFRKDRLEIDGIRTKRV
jgi:hypothetical protein